MSSEDVFYGVDIGTSSAKLLATCGGRVIFRARRRYRSPDPPGWKAAVKSLVKSAVNATGAPCVRGIGLSSQVGSYTVDGKTVISWQDPAGSEECRELAERFPAGIFLREIGMPHPKISSYPLPRLLYIKRAFPSFENVRQPKELVCEMMTGNAVSDPYSWRGLANPRTGKYSEYLLKTIGVPVSALPPQADPFESAGGVSASFSRITGLTEGTPVFTGMNDFFCALIAMNPSADDFFDLTGTSEHFGAVQPGPEPGTPLVCGPFIENYVHYGVTASSGASVRFAKELAGKTTPDFSSGSDFKSKPPVFLPYLRGERAPIFDADARGVFFGVSDGASRAELAYSVLEGCAFAVYHIYETMRRDTTNPGRRKRVITAGGASGNRLLNVLKATMLNLPVFPAAEPEASALGAAVIAEAGIGRETWRAVAARYANANDPVLPNAAAREPLLRRYAVYKSLYPALGGLFREFASL